MDATDGRRQRGLEIAARCRIGQRDGAWVVPSQSGAGRYSVVMSARGPRCTGPDHESRGEDCKHILAVRGVIDREQNPDGSTTVTKTISVTETVRRTYPQKWAKYNAAQTTEKDRFLVLLHDRPVPRHSGGQAQRTVRLSIADAIFSAAFKVYSTVSARRFMTDLRAAHAHGYLARVPHYNSIFNYLKSPDVRPILKSLIVESSLPLKAVEVDFAADFSGLTTSRFSRWFDHRYGVVRQQHDWVRCISCAASRPTLSRRGDSRPGCGGH